MLVGPKNPGDAHTGLDFIIDKDDVFFVTNLAQAAGKIGPYLVVTPLALNRLNDEGGDVVWMRMQRLLDLVQGLPFRRLHLLHDLIGDGETQPGMSDQGPVEPGVIEGFARVMTIGEAHGIARTAVKAVPEVDHLGTPLTVTGRHIFPHLPIEGRFEGVFHRQTASFDKKGVGQVVRNAEGGKGVHKLSVFLGVDVRKGRLVHRRSGETLLIGQQRRVIVAHGHRGKHGEQVQVFLPCHGVMDP